jgi:hypothetical protein
MGTPRFALWWGASSLNRGVLAIPKTAARPLESEILLWLNFDTISFSQGKLIFQQLRFSYVPP